MKNSISQVVNQITSFAPLSLLVSMFLAFAAMFIFQLRFYTDTLTPQLGDLGMVLAFSIAIVTQAARLSFGLSSANDFLAGKYGSGTLGLLFSLGVTLFEHYECGVIAAHYGGEDYKTWLMLLRFITWAAVAFELRVILLLKKKKAQANTNQSTSLQTILGNGQHTNGQVQPAHP